MSERIYLYPIWIRVWHIINAILIIILIATGLSMQYASLEFSLIDFSAAVKIHNVTGIITVFNYILFLAGNILTGNGRFYRMRWDGLRKRMLIQSRYYLFGVFRRESPPFPVTSDRKFNPLQKAAYGVIMYVCFPLIIITGIALFFPEITIHRVLGFSGLHLTALLHSIIGFLISIFLVVHIYFCTFGASPLVNFRSMINGYHESH